MFICQVFDERFLFVKVLSDSHNFFIVHACASCSTDIKIQHPLEIMLLSNNSINVISVNNAHATEQLFLKR